MDTELAAAIASSQVISVTRVFQILNPMNPDTTTAAEASASSAVIFGTKTDKHAATKTAILRSVSANTCCEEKQKKANAKAC